MTVVNCLPVETALVIMQIICDSTERQNKHLNTMLAQGGTIVGHDPHKTAVLVEYPDDDYPGESTRMMVCMNPKCSCASQ